MLATTPQAMTVGSSIRHEVTFSSVDGLTVRGDIYQPSGHASEWSVVVCPGYGSIKDLMEPWGRSLAALGYQVCIVGYRGYGDAPGRLGRIFPNEHVNDARAAVRFLFDGSDESTRIAVLGVSYGGAVAIQTGADEPAVAAVISIVGYGSGSRHLHALRQDGEWADFLDRARMDRSNRVQTGVSKQISLNEILLRDAEAQRWRERVESEYPGMRFDVTWESVDRLLEFSPDRSLPFVRSLPLLIVHAEHDRVIPASEAELLIRLADEPKRLVILPEAEHHDVHNGETFRRCLDEVAQFLTGIDEGSAKPGGGTY